MDNLVVLSPINKVLMDNKCLCPMFVGDFTNNFRLAKEPDLNKKNI
jgi:hypothetical protein